MSYKIAWDKKVYELSLINEIAGENYVICPICTPSRKPEHQNDKKLAINTAMFPKKWRCNHCNAGGHVLEKEYLDSLAIKPMVNKPNDLSISDGLVQWFWEERKISINTLRHFDIRMNDESIMIQKAPKSHEHLKGKWQTQKCINFRYFMNNILVNIKFRDMWKNFKLMKGASMILYNIDSIKDYDYCVITEGEFEPMAYYEAGIIPVVSVPNGSAVSPSEVDEFNRTGKINVSTSIDMTYLDNCMDQFKDMKTIYLATDDDAAGYKLRELLAKRLGKARCKYIEFSQYSRQDGSPCNDPNDVLINCGKEQLAYSLQKAKPYPMKDVSTAKIYTEKISHNYDNGITPGLSTGFTSLDPHWRWMPGYFYVLNGWPQNGKTIFGMNIAVVSSLLYGWKWGIYSPENYPVDQLIESIIEIYLGNTLMAEYATTHNPRIAKEEMLNAITSFVEKHFHFIEDRMEGYTPVQLRNVKLRLWEYFGVNCFFTDPWKNLIHDDNMPLERYLNRELSAEVRFSTGNNAINMISTHPPTPKDKTKAMSVPSEYELYGGAVWNNSSYGMIAIHRQNRTSLDNTKVEIHIQKMKNQKLAGIPTQTPVIFDFQRRTNRYLGANESGTGYDSFPLDNLNINQTDLFTQF